MTTRPVAASVAFQSLVRYRARVLEVAGAAEVARELERTEANPEQLESLAQRGRVFPVRLDGVSDSAATILGRELASVGGDLAGPAASSKEGIHVLLATRAEYRRLLPRLRRQPMRLREIADAVESALAHFTARRPRRLKGLHRSVPLGDRTRVMGIVNVTPDSFFDGGKYLEPEQAVHRAVHLIEEGADIIDLGAESTRPGSAPVSADTEVSRLLPVLAKLHDESEVPISVDTRKPEVARVALDAGADLVNDVSGLRLAEMRRVLARTGAPAIAMHMRGTPQTMQSDLGYEDLRGEVYAALAQATATAIAEGVAPENLLVDPGLGFGKSAEQNLELLAHAGEFRSLGFPVALGASRKGFLGRALGGAPPHEREEASVAAAVIAALHGVEIVRVHDVRPTVRALSLTNAVRRGGFETVEPAARAVPPPSPRESG